MSDAVRRAASGPQAALVAVLARQIRTVGSGAVRFSEMLPDPDHARLVDAEGRRYTSELPLTAVDLAGRAPGERAGS